MQHKFILLGAITSLLPFLPSRSTPGTPEPSYSVEIVASQVAAFAAKDSNRLQGSVVRALVRKSPYVDVLEGGTMSSGVSDVQVAIVQERAVLNQSLVRPTFTLDKDICGASGVAADVGSKQYTYQLATNRGKGPLVCIKGMWAAFKTVYSAAEDALKKQLIQLNNADVRITLVDRAGLKMMLVAGQSFSNMFDGNVQDIDTAWPTVSTATKPNAAPNIRVLQYLARVMREDMLVEPFETDRGEPTLRFIGSQEVIDLLRDDAGVREDHRYIAAGSFQIGKMALTRYTWEGPYRGIAFGVDPQPLRYDDVSTASNPIYIEPEYAVVTSNGLASRPNPQWFRAKYEIGLLMGMNSFRKLAPEKYTGEGSFKFPAQSITGDLIWRNIQDNDNNVWQDFGRHYYQFTRAYKPERPHAVCAISYARQNVDFGLTAITDFGDWSATGSL